VDFFIVLIFSKWVDNTNPNLKALHDSYKILLFLKIDFMKSHKFTIIKLYIAEIAQLMYLTDLSRPNFQSFTQG